MATEFQFLEGEEEAGAPTTLRYRAPAGTAPQDPLGSGLTPPVDLAPRRRPEPVQPPAEMRAYEPTMLQQLGAGAQAGLENLGMDRYSARRTAQSLIGGPQSNLPLGAGFLDITGITTPLYMQEGYRATERAAGAFERGDYGGAAMEYLGAVGMMAPGGVLVAKGAPATFRAMGESMGANAPRMGGFSQSQRGIFAGPGAKTADLQALARAEAAELEGRDAQQVWQDTGWFRGADGKWRFEIDDSKAAFKGIEAFTKYREKEYAKLNAIEDAITIREYMNQGNSFEDALQKFRNNVSNSLAPGAAELARKFTVQSLENKLDNSRRVLRGVVKNVPMKELLEHPELFAAYPEFANMPVSFQTAKFLEGSAGQYVPGSPGAIDILQEFGITPARTAEGRSTMLHEGMHALQQREGFSPGTSMTEASQAMSAGRIPAGDPYEAYMRAAGETEARQIEARADLTPEERQQFFPMGPDMFGPEYPVGEQLVGRAREAFPPAQGTARSLSMGPAGSQRGAVLFGMGGEPQRPLRDLLADQPTTLRTLENLPGKRTELTVQEIQDQMRRPEVTREEKDVLNRVLERSAPGGRISAENLVREVGLETKDFSLTPQDTDRFADYGLQTIGRETGDYSYVTMGSATPNIEKVRTTVHRSPTPTSADNHFRDPNYFGHTRAFTADGIPHVVEIQSDLVQKAGKELSPAERTQLEQQVQSTTPQISLLDSVVPRNSRDVPEPEVLAANLRTVLPQLEALNPDARLFIGSELNSGWRFHDMGVSDVEVVDRALSMLTPNNPLRRDVAYDVFTSLNKFKDDLILQQAEASSKLAERGAATAQRPMFKNWERRLIREELSRAATPQVTPEYARFRKASKDTIKQIKEAEAYYREQGLSEGEIASLTRQLRADAERYAKSAQETPQYLPTPSVVRFADADTVALVEGWPRKLEYTPGEARDYALEGKRLPGSSAGTVNDWRYTGMVRMDENGIWEAERLPIDVDGRVIGEAKWSNRGTAQISEDIINRFVKPTDKFEDAGHQGIYDRYKKEVTNYLKSLGAKPYKDSMGHSWWEVPVKPEQRRTQIFSMGGGAVAAGGAATYNGAEAEAQ